MADRYFQCGGCGKQSPFHPAAKPGAARCRHCGAVTALPQRVAASGAKKKRPAAKQAATPPSSGAGARALVIALLAAYFPFLAAIGLAAFGVAAWLFSGAPPGRGPRLPFTNILGGALVLVGLAGAAAVVHLVADLVGVLRRSSRKDPLAFEFPDEWQEPLLALIDEVSVKGDLPEPDRIHIHAADVAHVYEDRRGRYVLAIGGLAIAALPQRSLAGVIAHELGHFAGGDTALSRLASHWHRVMGVLDYHLRVSPFHRLNPVTWVIRGYHFLYELAWSASSRVDEYAADRHTVELIGPEQTAATLVLIDVLHNMPWANLQAVAEQFVVANERPKDLFAEQVRRVKGATFGEWDEAMRKSLKCKTGPFDSHPCLRERLKAVGVPPKEALRLAMDLSGAPSTELFANWPVVEKFLSDRIFNIVRAIYWERRDFEDLASALLRSRAIRMR